MQLGRTIQFVLSKARFLGSESEFTTLHRLIKPGDVVRAQGFVGKTNSGELSLFLTSLKLLAPCLHDLPFKSGLRGSEKRFRNRHVDFLVNDTPARVLLVRSKVLHFIRNYLNARNFIEVETPILSTEVGGANAQPFVTRSTAMGDLDLYLRIAPELFLKVATQQHYRISLPFLSRHADQKLVIGGVERVYEIGKQFRNEGVDADHNPEFTTCEFYQAYTNLEGLMSTTEEMMQDAAEKLLNICNASGAPPVQEPINVPRILDHLISTFIEPECVQPTFLVNHPAIMCPLAKTIDPEGQISGRFELFVNTKEIVNAYEELNDPDEQRRRFMVQLKDRLSGDAEVPVPDDEFCDALEFGLPPTGGWGMGIDRVVALLAGVKHLRETIAFPIMRPHA
ncbi:hypothetical protein EV182_003854 [Spiromyces aspiralis]|uniref:Uncharacterized protein n=1 Tax=Spiromyces aspiralis TaxID=68401 RepID=A0ACC1HTG8_9FUNG|nr:hypothetical protein EV182_003854 [Spiromyces aspiralis]